MKKNNECVIRNFVAHSSQTVRFNSGKHKNKKRISELKGRYAKHKKGNNYSHDCYLFC